MTIQLGFNARIYYGTDIGDLAELRHVRTATLSLACDGSDLTPHASGGWKASTHTLRDATLTFTLLWDIADAGLLALRDAYLNDSTINLMFLDGADDDPLHAPEGLMAACIITKFARDERSTDAIAVSITAKPTLAEFDPSWMQGLIDIDNGEFVLDDLTGQIVMVAA